MSKVVHINKPEELGTITKDHKYVVVDFYADWCGPCKALAPIIEELATSFSDVTFVKVDVDKVKSLAEEYGISAIPTLIYFKDGKAQPDRTFGFVPKPKLLTAINNLKDKK